MRRPLGDAPSLRLITRSKHDRNTPTPVERIIDAGDRRSIVFPLLSREAWRLLRETRTNVLLIGNAQVTDAVLIELTSRSPAVFEWTPKRSLPSPSNCTATLVIRNLCALSITWQQNWLDWLIGRPRHIPGS